MGKIFTAAVESVLLAAEQPAEANEGKLYLLQILIESLDLPDSPKLLESQQLLTACYQCQ